MNLTTEQRKLIKNWRNNLPPKTITSFITANGEIWNFAFVLIDNEIKAVYVSEQDRENILALPEYTQFYKEAGDYTFIEYFNHEESK